MDNASELIPDAHALLERGSFGRARSLTVLAQEELGKAFGSTRVSSRPGAPDPRMRGRCRGSRRTVATTR
ncbi:AbiV family abortive infection protein [Streptomyces sp. NPDC006265]|uniref:AbiV family abortive infection protein n=1 Tax=Streptomyces sp. NPDC006265 TaxID=3156740 RepID=UPI0033A49308